MRICCRNCFKAQICKTLNWFGFPSTKNEFENYRSFKTHNLDVLFSFTGFEKTLKATYLAEWSAINTWNPETRYNAVSAAESEEAMLIINSAKTLIEIL